MSDRRTESDSTPWIRGFSVGYLIPTLILLLHWCFDTVPTSFGTAFVTVYALGLLLYTFRGRGT